MAVSCNDLVFARGAFTIRANWSLEAGQSLALLGVSGAGKSLFLGGLAGFETQSAGYLSLAGQAMERVPPARRPISLMFQDHNLFPHMTAFENVALGLDPGGRLSDADRQCAEDALAAVDLAGLEGRRPAELSGGQQSRVALARVLVRRRPVLALDEPFASLGPGHRRDMFALVENICAQSGATLLFVSHLPEEAAQADLVAFVGDGEVAAPVPPDRFFADPPATLRDYL